MPPEISPGGTLTPTKIDRKQKIPVVYRPSPRSLSPSTGHFLKSAWAGKQQIDLRRRDPAHALFKKCPVSAEHALEERKRRVWQSGQKC